MPPRAGLPLPEPPLEDAEAGIVLRPWGTSPGDPDALAAAWADPLVRSETRVPEDRSRPAAAGWIAGEAERRRRGLALDLVISGRGRQPADVLGEVGLANLDGRGRAEIGFWLVEAARGGGVAGRAVDLVTGWALGAGGLGRRQLWARVRPGNEAAGRTLARAGYTCLGEAGSWVIWSRSV